MTRARRDPRADALAQQVDSPSRLRLDRSHRAIGAMAARGRRPAAEPAAPRVIIVDDPAFLVAVVPDAPDGRLTARDRQLFGAARVLAGAAGAVVAIVPPGCDALGLAGADRVALLGEARAAYDPPDGGPEPDGPRGQGGGRRGGHVRPVPPARPVH